MRSFLKTSFPNYFSIALMIASLFLLSQTGAVVVKAAGEIDPTFNATVYRQPGGNVSTVVVQPDGKILIGGNFEVIGGFTRRLTRLNADGTVDATFNPPQFSSGINTIGLQSNGKIIVAGIFTIVGGNNVAAPIVRLNPDGSLDASFNVPLQSGTQFTGIINDIDVRPDDRILIGGSFSYRALADGSLRSNLARLNPDGSTDLSFTVAAETLVVEDIAVQPDGKIFGFATPSGGGSSRFLRRLNADGTQDSSFNALVGATVYAHKIQPDGKILIGGNFTNVNNFPRNSIARLNPDGSLDETFAGSTNAVTVYDIEFAPDGKILISGNFFDYNGSPTDLIAKLNDNGTVDTSLNFNRNVGAYTYNSVLDIAPQPNGQIVIGGTVARFTSQGAAVNRINADGSLDASVQVLVGIMGTVEKVLSQPNGQTLVAGIFGGVNNTIRPSIARLNPDGSTDATFNPPVFGVNLDPRVRTLALQPDGKILVGGQFVSTGNLAMLVRLNPDGSLDPSFAPALDRSGHIFDIAVQPDGKIIAGGDVRLAGSNFIQFLVRFNQDGSVDNTFQVPPPSGTIRRIVLQPDGKILVGGDFSSFGNITRSKIARLNADGSLDSSFNPLGGANSTVYDVALQNDGKVIIGGSFTGVNGFARMFLARLNPDGSLDTGFNSAANSFLQAIRLQPGGKILVGGYFTNIAGVTRNRIARLNQDGSVDLSFNASVDGNAFVVTIDLSPDGKILAGGNFSRVNNVPKISIVRLLSDAAPRAKPFDYDGDGKSDLSVFRPSTGFWYIARPTGSPSQNFDAVQFGVNGDVIVPADYDADGKTDVAVWRPSDGVWYMMQSTAGFRTAQFGASGDIPVPGDFDGDGKANLAVFRPSTGSWYIARATGMPSQNFDTVPFGANGDKPIAGADFDGDGRADVAVFRPSDGNWYRINSSNNQFVGIHFGIAEDKPVAADYDGDGKTDLAVWRPSDGVWYRINSGSDTFTATQFGISTDLPAPADYDGDGKADLAVFRPAEGIWYLLRSTQGFTGLQFGASGDIPTPNAYVR
jgi:uncharacterized delta-60 repeat protein